ncbi:transglycosylase family protein [Streptomyces sp. NBC_00893]|uniref:LysM peptidoglycan-binding domain-containing protein n=1 Tax=Streptomyces sp. NBC_00893 TaxID=2975862 RepID=UPI0022515BC2|nr:transglycosylase family protein [Streptomyces sp. NBC_00893]MCX4847550.1 LysM peptidoglycan-binding domain-containing protein [Streptomyces sp. NBC_00893]
MGSANGRHRRPRQAPAIVVAAGVTGSAIAIPLLGASGAHAADAQTWDRVAECESGGMWSADLGNDYYGGLQFSQETWKAYGGEAYAERADLASRAQQIAVAEKVLDARGPKAWPSCAVISGLAVDGTLPGVDPGSAPADDPTGSAKPSDDASADPSDDATPSDSASDGTDAVDGTDGSEKTDEPSGKASPSPKPSTSTTPSPEASTDAPSGTPGDASGSPDAPGGTGGKHRGAPAAEKGGGTAGGGREAGRHASRGGNDARDTADTPADGTYTVHTGDNLWSIADAQNIPGGWPALYEANKAAVGADPDLILPGQSLDLDVKAK